MLRRAIICEAVRRKWRVKVEIEQTPGLLRAHTGKSRSFYGQDFLVCAGSEQARGIQVLRPQERNAEMGHGRGLGREIAHFCICAEKKPLYNDARGVFLCRRAEDYPPMPQ